MSDSLPYFVPLRHRKFSGKITTLIEKQQLGDWFTPSKYPALQ